MSSKSSPKWDTEPKINESYRKYDESKQKLNSGPKEFYAIYHTLNASRHHLSANLMRSLTADFTGFVDRAHPFYESDFPMYAVDVTKNNIDRLKEELESEGYGVEIRHDTAQFCFIPQRTTGEIVLRGKPCQQ